MQKRTKCMEQWIEPVVSYTLLTLRQIEFDPAVAIMLTIASFIEGGRTVESHGCASGNLLSKGWLRSARKTVIASMPDQSGAPSYAPG
ncbi:hypothetical protein [Massilia pseudoviolaceinigra]|uniref:hypothetical protein n=1 Tax=Massilia pseudoviolaceinigra TaxID=3057165 RepID=UPI002796B591|nr:hypothetical protein [Massilia sp. CCM 9206]MDQ1922577.1 hypothetical protein [Massilia sp. CCM 9206]